jgi:hypothetical protein
MPPRAICVRRARVRPLHCPGFRPVTITDRFLVAVELRRSSTKETIGVIDFLIDTGADRTSISTDDAERLSIYDLPLVGGCPPRARGIGGDMPLRYLQSVALLFHGPEGQEPASWSLTEIAVLFPNSAQRKAGAFSGCPSLLGRDFLDHCHLDISREEIRLHFYS